MSTSAGHRPSWTDSQYGDSRGPKLQHTRRTLKVHGVRATEPVGRKDSAPRAPFLAQRRSFGDISTATRLAPQSRTTDALTAPCVRAGVATVLLRFVAGGQSVRARTCVCPSKTAHALQRQQPDSSVPALGCDRPTDVREDGR